MCYALGITWNHRISFFFHGARPLFRCFVFGHYIAYSEKEALFLVILFEWSVFPRQNNIFLLNSFMFRECIQWHPIFHMDSWYFLGPIFSSTFQLCLNSPFTAVFELEIYCFLLALHFAIYNWSICCCFGFAFYHL